MQNLELTWFVLALAACLVLGGCGGEGPADTGVKTGPVQSGPATDLKGRTKSAIDKGLAYLHDKFDLAQGGWTVQGKADPGITGLVVTAFARSPRKYTAGDGPFMRKSLEFLASHARPDGSIHDGMLANYKTSAALQALAAAGGKKYAALVKKGRDYLVQIQLDDSEGFSEDHKYYGGAGYGGDRRPDMSNLSLWVDGLLASGEKPGNTPYRRALRFLERCQNDSEVNTGRYEIKGKVYVSGNDGGGVYGPGVSKAGSIDRGDGTLEPRSYGSMTYALLKGYMAADLKADDPRVQKAMKWIAANFTLDENPGFDKQRNPRAGLQGLYYYFYTLAKALELYGRDRVEDERGKAHDWRQELAEKILSLQEKDGSWVNRDAPRWWEGMPVLATSYAVLALGICHQGFQ